MSHRVAVVIGVAGSGKTTVAQLIADRLGYPFADGDDFHPSVNIDKMRSGAPLTDDDRWPWLSSIAAWIATRRAQGSGGVVACSALKRAYRDVLRQTSPDIVFIALVGDRQLLQRRLAQRVGHFMPVRLLDSQLAAFEPIEADELGASYNATESPARLAGRAARLLSAAGSDTADGPRSTPDGPSSRRCPRL